MGILLFLFLPAAWGEMETAAEVTLPPGIETADHEDMTVFTLRNPPENVSAAEYLTRYYLEEGPYAEILISCFLSMETTFPSDEYDIASRQVLEIYDAFVRKGIAEANIYISVRFEKNVESAGMITVEFLKNSGYFERAGRNFFTGITDIVSSPLELPMGMVSESRKSGMVTGVTKGVFAGFGQALRKAGTGTIKLLTFWAG